MRQHAHIMIKNILDENMPQPAVQRALAGHNFTGHVYILAIGKAAWAMTKAATDFLGDRLARGIVITKYGHSRGNIPGIDIYEAAHPIIDSNAIKATEKAVAMARTLGHNDELLFFISGGGSALFELPLPGITLDDLKALSSKLLASGADIVEINMLRKRLSAVKAGRFAAMAAPAKVFAIVLSDVLGDRLDSIASGPAAPDASTAVDAHKVVEKYNIQLNSTMESYLTQETPKTADNVKTVITGSVRLLCESAAKAANQLGYTPHILTTMLNCEAGHAGKFLASIAMDIQNNTSTFKAPCAIICGGETVVNVKGNGKGGRNQELALAAARGIAGLNNTLLFSLGSDGTDGPTDAAGGMVDGHTAAKLKMAGLDIDAVLANNNSYNALTVVDGLIITGPTGTNVNDVAVLLIGGDYDQY